MFRVKICGITNLEDVAGSVAAGADAVGLNFYDNSPRRVSIEAAERIARATPGGILKVGVFVNATIETIRRAVQACGLDAVQLHGDEDLEFIQRLHPLPVIRAHRLAVGQSAELLSRWTEDAACPRGPRALLIDAATPHFGGTGLSPPWDEIPPPSNRPQLPLLLAGGLVPENVAAAIHRVRPRGVDVASGVESIPGIKDPARVLAFVRAALAALDGRPEEG